MIPLTNKHKLPFRTPPSFFRELKRTLEVLVEEELKYGKRVVSREAMLNAILLDFLSKPVESRKEIVREGVKRLYALKEPVEFVGSAGQVPPGGEGDPSGGVGGSRPPDAGFESREEPKRSARKRAR